MDERSFIGIAIPYHLYRAFPIIMNGRGCILARMSRGRMTPRLFLEAIAVLAAIVAAKARKKATARRAMRWNFIPSLYSCGATRPATEESFGSQNIPWR